MANLYSQVPLQILTGFLGSGKTTLLNKVINNPDMKGTVLIINEVGEVGIDDKLVSTENPVVLLDSGCICCTVQDGLVQSLHFLAEARDKGELDFKRVIIETTGIADPAPIIDLLFNFIDIDVTYSFAGTITVVDGVNAKEELANNYESVKQIAMADKIIISKEDLISTEDLEAIKYTARDLNPDADIFTASKDVTPFEAFVKYDVFSTPRDIKSIMNWVNSKRQDYKLASGMTPVKINALGKTLKTHSNYQTLSFTYDKPLNRISVIHAFDEINATYGSAVLRMKGIFDFGEGYPFVIHGVCGTCYPINNQADWDADKPFSEMVVIVSPKIAKEVEKMINDMIETIE